MRSAILQLMQYTAISGRHRHASALIGAGNFWRDRQVKKQSARLSAQPYRDFPPNYPSSMLQFETRRRSQDKVLLNLWRVVSVYRWRVAGALIFLVLAKIATVVVPLLLKDIVDILSRPA